MRAQERAFFHLGRQHVPARSAWLTSGLVGLRHGRQAAFAILSLGGMLIVPVSLLIRRGLLDAGRPAFGNPLERLGLESTAVLFAGILIAFALLRGAPDLAFPALAVAVCTSHRCRSRRCSRWHRREHILARAIAPLEAARSILSVSERQAFVFDPRSGRSGLHPAVSTPAIHSAKHEVTYQTSTMGAPVGR
ncbi:DUF7010 family protein [Sphingomonas bacterium]|uniref:DUF7010 family protein n=1 Tax=Sphingomonas bacterium TaxID=1895847 RepID=UPI001574FFB3|nr:hypothetical protein [Sphingomonas bacterium]